MTTLRQILLTAAGVLLAVCILDLIKWMDVERPSLILLVWVASLLVLSAGAAMIGEYMKR